jgi:hypothetical protein
MKRLAFVLAAASLMLCSSWPGFVGAGEAPGDRCDVEDVALDKPASESPTLLAQTYTCSGSFGCAKQTRYTCRWDYVARACTWQVSSSTCAFMDDPVTPGTVCR